MENKPLSGEDRHTLDCRRREALLDSGYRQKSLHRVADISV